MGKTGPPNDDKNPDFIKNRDVSVLMNQVPVNAQSCGQLLTEFTNRKI